MPPGRGFKIGLDQLFELNVKVHLSGVAIAYPDNKALKKGEETIPGRYQGSLVNQQKRAISDAIEWMRLYGHNKPLFFVLTSPGYATAKDHAAKIQKFTHTLRNGYACKDYVWVRELTKMGAPHYHFVADMPWVRSPVEISRYWSSLFGSDASNSLRLGSAPIAGKRKYYVDSVQAAKYISKYIGKDLSNLTNTMMEAGYPGGRYVKTFRSFAISERARLMSKPVVYQANYHFDEREAWNHAEQCVKVRTFVNRTFENEVGEYIDPSGYRWKRIEPHNVFLGFKD